MPDIALKGMMLGLIGIFFVCPYHFSVGIFKLKYNTVPIGVRILAMIPVVNICKAEYNYKGRMGIVSYSSIVSSLSLFVRLLAAFTTRNHIITLITVISVIVTTALNVVSLIWFNITILKDSNQRLSIGTLFIAIVYPLGQYFIGTLLNRVIKNSLKRERNYI